MKLKDFQKARDLQDAIIGFRSGKGYRLKDLQKMRNLTNHLISIFLFEDEK